MLQFFRFILGFFSFILLVVLVNVSFFSNGDDEKIDLQFLDSSSFSGSNIDNINFLDNIYSSLSESYEVIEKSNNIDIILGKGVFILDLNDLTKKYKISGNGFNIDLKATGDIYIDTTGNKSLIFSLNSSFVLNFLDKDDKFMNSYFMYPHEFIKFNPKLTFSYNKVDLYRIRTITKNGYFNYRLLSILDDKNIEYFASMIGDENIDLFKKYIVNKNNNLSIYSDLYKQITLLETVDFPFADYINKYNSYFINDSKRAIYLQNNIYNKLVKLFNDDKYNIDALSSIKSDLELLKSIDNSKYEVSNDIINKFYKIIVLKYNISNSIKIENFTHLINSDIDILSLKNYISLKSIYFNYDFSLSNNTVLYFDKFLSSYLNNSGIVEQNENFTLNKQEKLSEIESFVFFLNEYINAHLFLGGIEKFKSEVSILSKYNNLNKMIYFSGKKDKDVVKQRTSFNEYEDLLFKLESFLKITFFENYRDETLNILLLKKIKGKSLDFNILVDFEKEIKNIFSLFNSNKSILSGVNNDQEIKYNELLLTLEEEFLAIKDYERYRASGNAQLRALSESTGLGAKKLKSYTISDINTYLSQFKGFNFNSNNIVKKDSYFSVTDISIHNLYYDVKFYPNLGNKIDFFNKGKDKVIFSYNLDLIKELWDEKAKGADKEEKEKYDFSNFFDQKFKKYSGSTVSSSREEICGLTGQVPDLSKKEGCKDVEFEDATITVFKKNTLIKEEFGTIRDYFTIKYSNLDVNLNGNNYLIKINNSKIKLNIKNNNTNKRYSLDFSSNYDFEKHSFYNINFKIEDEKNKGSYLLDGTSINFKNKKIKITELNNYLEKYIIDIDNVSQVYNRIRGEFILNNIILENINGKTYLKFDNNGKNIMIVIEKDNIISVLKDGSYILSTPIKISEINTIINKLK